MTAYNTRRAKTVIAISQSTKNELVKYIGADPEKIIVIPQGAVAQFQMIKDRSILDRVTKRYQLSPSFLLYCGVHKKHKSLERLISAYDQLPTTIKQRFLLLITGKPGVDTDSLRSQVKQRSLENNIHFIGYVPKDHLPTLNTLASLSTLPCFYEGFGVTPIESMACGTPAIGSNTSAIPEVVGDAGRLFDPYSINDITQKIVTAIPHDVNSQAVQQKCLDHVKQFSWDIKDVSTSK
jgi:glycosyltransferase involved in cell wall biosynthesis